MAEGITPTERKNKEKRLGAHFQDAKRAFDMELRRRNQERGNGLGQWQPVPHNYYRQQDQAWRAYRYSPQIRWPEEREDYARPQVRGSNYTSFDDPTPKPLPRPAGPKHTDWAEVKQLAGSGLSTRTLAPWDTDAVVCFAGRDHWLSNFHREAPITIDGHQYHTLEHYYQACKLYMLGGAGLSAQVRGVSDAGAVKTLTKRILREGGVPERALEDWRVKEGPRLLEYGLMHKFVQSRELRAQLLETKDAFLAHTYDRDRVFAVGCKEEDFLAWVKTVEGQAAEIPNALNPDTVPYFPRLGKGKNLLGLIVMRVRDAIRRNIGAVEGMEEAVEEADGDVAKRKALAAGVADSLKETDPVLARALASLATKPAVDISLIQKIRALKISKDKERAERFAQREAQRQAVKEAAAKVTKDKGDKENKKIKEKAKAENKDDSDKDKEDSAEEPKDSSEEPDPPKVDKAEKKKKKKDKK